MAKPSRLARRAQHPMILDRKIAALAAQPSQTEALRTAAGDDYYRRVISSERFGRFQR
jgi:hypothetical protein